MVLTLLLMPLLVAFGYLLASLTRRPYTPPRQPDTSIDDELAILSEALRTAELPTPEQPE